jgi:hypothetical protein
MNKFTFRPLSKVIEIQSINSDSTGKAIKSYNDLMNELKLKYPNRNFDWDSYKIDSNTNILYLYKSKL